MECRFRKGNHLLSAMKMKVRLHAGRADGSRCPVLPLCAVPNIAKLILRASLAVARDMVVHRVDRSCSGSQSPLIGSIGIIDIQMNRELARGMLLASLSQLNHRIADADFRVHDFAVGPRHAQTLGPLESGFEEFNELAGSLHNNVWRDIIKTGAHKWRKRRLRRFRG